MVEVFRQVRMVVHGGAGTIRPSDLTVEREQACRDALVRALRAGDSVFASGGDALAMAVAAVCVLEDDPVFNAGRGGVLDAEGKVSMDAAVMRGVDGVAGAVSGIRTIRNPVLAARCVMEDTPFVFLAGDGAERFASQCGLPTEEPEYFVTPERLRQWKVQRARGSVSLSEDNKFGTVGAAARDGHGGLAAATSTGGMTNKACGRVGDTPVIGAGTWADNRTLAVSATGHGEFFIRSVACHAVHARMELRGDTLDHAMADVVDGILGPMGGDGGMVAVGADGDGALAFNCPGMYRGVLFDDGRILTGIYRDNCR